MHTRRHKNIHYHYTTHKATVHATLATHNAQQQSRRPCAVYTVHGTHPEQHHTHLMARAPMVYYISCWKQTKLIYPMPLMLRRPHTKGKTSNRESCMYLTNVCFSRGSPAQHFIIICPATLQCWPSLPSLPTLPFSATQAIIAVVAVLAV